MLGIQDRKFSTHFSSFKQGESFLCHNFLEKKTNWIVPAIKMNQMQGNRKSVFKNQLNQKVKLMVKNL